MIQRFERFSFAISQISRCWHRIAGEEMHQYDLNGPCAVYFTTLFQHPEGVTAVQLSELCGRDKADVSRSLTLLEKKGFVYRNNPQQKSYRTGVFLTEQGLALAVQINEKAKLAVEQASSGLSPEKREIFYEALGLITENLMTLSRIGLPGNQDKEDGND